MSGRKNHHVPQFLQRGFGIKKKKAVQVWVYTRDEPQFLTSTANFGAERDFYIEAGDNYVDELITEFEDEIQNLIRELRAGASIAIEDTENIASLLAHLEMRSKFLREEMLFLSERLFSEIKRYLSRRQNMVNFMRKASSENPEMISDRLDEMNLMDDQKKLAESWVEANLDGYLESNVDQFVQDVGPLMLQLVEKLASVVKSSHLKALRKNLKPIGRRGAYLDMRYEIVHFVNGKLILPDTMVVFVKRGGRITPFLDETDSVEEVFLPLATDCLLYGYKNTPNRRKLDTINRMLASCASQRYVACLSCDYFAALRSRIGKNAQMIPRSEINRVIREALE